MSAGTASIYPKLSGLQLNARWARWSGEQAALFSETEAIENHQSYNNVTDEDKLKPRMLI